MMHQQIMSIYSGFPTRKDETNYNQLLARIIQLLQAHLLELLPPQKLSNSKVFAYTKVITKMQQYEEHKYLPPKFSQLLQPLSTLIGIPTKLDLPSSPHNSAIQTPQQKIKSFHSNNKGSPITDHPNANSDTKQKSLATFRGNQEKEAFTQPNIRSRKTSKGSESVAKRKEHKFHGSFYDIQQQKIRQMHEKYHHRVQQVHQRIVFEEEDKVNYRSQTESPADIYKELKTSKYDPANKYGIIHMKALKEAHEQLKSLKSNTPKRTRARTQFT